MLDWETLLPVCKVQFSKDTYFISPVIEMNAKWKYLVKTSQAAKKELWNVQCMGAPIAAVMSFWNLEWKNCEKQAKSLPLLKTDYGQR